MTSRTIAVLASIGIIISLVLYFVHVLNYDGSFLLAASLFFIGVLLQGKFGEVINGRS